MDIHQQKSAVALLSVASNTVLVVLKVLTGVAIGSVSVISEGIHSGVDLFAAIIALFAVRMVRHPADQRHPFGHGKMENLSGTIEALLIFVAAGWIISEAIQKLWNPQPLEATTWGCAVMLVSTVVNIIVSHRLFKVGRATQSVALQADAWHLRTDVYTSFGVMLAMAAIGGGKLIRPDCNLDWLDPVAAMVVALLIIKAAYHLTVESARDLLDISLAPEEESWMRAFIAGHYPAVKGYHHLRTRKAGADRFVEFHLVVNPRMSVEKSHQLAESITQGIRHQFPGTTVTVHIEPCNGYCSSNCRANCLMSAEEQRAVRAHKNKSA